MSVPQDFPVISALRFGFCQEYVKDHNATQSAIRSGYAKIGARQRGSLLLSDNDIQKTIALLEEQLAIESKISVDEIVQEIKKLAFFNIQDLYDKDGIPIPIQHLPSHVTTCIHQASNIRKVKRLETRSLFDNADAQIETTYEQVIDFKIHDKIKALDMLMRFVGGYEKDREVTNVAPTQINYNILAKTS